MKNKIRKILLTTSVVLAAFTFTACGGSDDNAEAGDAAQTADDSAENAEDSSTGETDNELMEKYASVQELLDDPSVRESLEAEISNAGMEESGMSMEVLAEDNKLVYCVIVEDSSLADALASNLDILEEGFDDSASDMGTVAASLSDAVDIENPTVVFRYVRSDGTEIASREYTAADATAADDTAADEATADDAAAADAAADSTAE